MQPAKTRIQGLDIIRGIAIGLVLIRHAWPTVFGGAGIAGVVVFFALSGYLITGLLVGDVDRFGHVRYGRFYFHRATRLLPPLLLLLLGYVVVRYTVNPLNEAFSIVRPLAVAMFYVADLPGFGTSAALGHLWTLAIEEQFYIIWPIVILIGVRSRKLDLLSWLSAAVIYVSCIATLIMANPNYEKVYQLPTSWTVAMVIGAAARIHQTTLSQRTFSTPIRRRVLGSAGLVALALISMIPEAKNWPGSYLALGPIIALSTVALVFWLRDLRSAPRLLQPMVYLGVISYAVYLWDYPIQVWLAPVGTIDAVRGALTIPLAIGFGVASRYLVERPAQRLRESIDAGRGRHRAATSTPAVDPGVLPAQVGDMESTAKIHQT
jgi:peptidoglycan/LPS O-acetylase OafA/YrhL